MFTYEDHYECLRFTENLVNDVIPPNAVPVMSNVDVIGNLIEGQVVVGVGDYFDIEGDAEGVHIHEWYVADDSSGTNEVRDTEFTSNSVTIPARWVGKYIRYVRTPIAATGSSPGIAASSVRKVVAVLGMYKVDYMYDQRFMISDDKVNGDYVGRVDLLQNRSDGSERFAISVNDNDTFSIDNETGIISIADDTQLDGGTTPDMQITVSGTLDSHSDQNSIISIKVFTIQNTYYVRPDGDDGNTGTSDSAGGAWATLNYAASQVVPGDKVWIMAGNYGGEHIATSIDGTATLPIVYEGYKTTPGDITDGIIDKTFTYHSNYSIGDTMLASEMPLYDGGNPAIAGGVWIYASGENYVSFKNLQARRYWQGFQASSVTEGFLENILTDEFGDGSEGGDALAIYTPYCTRYTIRNCKAYNPTNTGILLSGTDNVIDWCEIWCNRGFDSWDISLDYYIVMQGTGNKAYNCYIERVGDLRHNGHGYNFSSAQVTETSNNLYKNCISQGVGIGFQFRKPDVFHNLVEDCWVYGGHSDLNGGGGAIVFENGASYNTVRRLYCEDAWHGISLYQNTGELDVNPFVGRHNRVEHSLFINTIHAAIDFHWYTSEGYIADYLEFENCVFDNTGYTNYQTATRVPNWETQGYLFNIDRENNNTKLRNCVISGFKNYADRVQNRYNGNGYYDLNVEYESCNFYNNNFPTPSGTDITTHNPLHEGNGDWTPQESSPLLNIGAVSNLLGNNLLAVESQYGHIGNFRTGIESWVDAGTNQLSRDSSIDNGALRAIGVDNTTGGRVDLHSATGDLASNLGVGTDYEVLIEAAVNDGDSIDIVVWDGAASHTQTITSDEFTAYKFPIAIQAGTTPYVEFANLGVGEIIWVKWYNCRQVVSTFPVTDYYNNDLIGLPDLGAIEFQATPVSVTSVGVTSQGDVTVITTPNGTLQFYETVLPSDASNKGVTWSVINGTGSANITQSGLLTAIGDGTVTVRATSQDGGGIYGQMVITLSNQPTLVTSISVAGTGGATTIDVEDGTLQMLETVLPVDASNKNVTWSVIDGTGEGSISTGGLLTAEADGTVTVRATAQDGSGIYGEEEITISNQPGELGDNLLLDGKGVFTNTVETWRDAGSGTPNTVEWVNDGGVTAMHCKMETGGDNHGALVSLRDAPEGDMEFEFEIGKDYRITLVIKVLSSGMKLSIGGVCASADGYTEEMTTGTHGTYTTVTKDITATAVRGYMQGYGMLANEEFWLDYYRVQEVL